MLDLLLSLFFMMTLSTLGLLFLFLLYRTMKNTTSFQKLNRLTILAVVITLFGLLFLGYTLFHSVIGALLVLFLIRISYVIYIDTE